MKKVAIIGYGSNWSEAPFSDSSVEIWVQNISEILKYNFSRFDRVFDIHPKEIILEEAKADPQGLEFCKKWDKMVIVQEPFAELPLARAYPLDEITPYFFPWAVHVSKWNWIDSYWTSSTEMMIALAIYEEYNEIGIYGIDMSDTPEYRDQRKGCEYMLGVAHGRGIAIKKSSTTPVLRTKYIYGYQDKEMNAFKNNIEVQKNFLRQQIAELNGKGTEAAFKKAHLEGALHAYDNLEVNWLDK